MKKTVWIIIVAGLVVAIAFLISREKPQGEQGNRVSEQVVEGRKPETGSNDVSRVSRLPDAGNTIANPVPAISDAVKTIIGMDAGYKERLEAMRNLALEISPEDLVALKGFLAAPMPEGLAISLIGYNSIRNDVMDILLQAQSLPEGIGQLLVDIYSNPRQDEIWRNYSIQFMAPFYERQSKDVGSMPSSGDSVPLIDELKLVEETLWKALEERDNSNAGTALLGLDKLSRNHPEFDRKQIDAAMLDLASDDQASVANRITAIRMCGEQGNTHALETARNLAQNGDITMLRCSAIATLGDLGTEDDLVLLETYAASADERIRNIAQQALEKFSSK